MHIIFIHYNDKLIENQKMFDQTIKELKSLYKKTISFKKSKLIKLQIEFNNRIIYSLDDSFDSDALIDEGVLCKIENLIENSIKINQSRDISPVDDIGIDDF